MIFWYSSLQKQSYFSRKTSLMKKAHNSITMIGGHIWNHPKQMYLVTFNRGKQYDLTPFTMRISANEIQLTPVRAQWPRTGSNINGVGSELGTQSLTQRWPLPTDKSQAWCHTPVIPKLQRRIRSSKSPWTTLKPRVKKGKGRWKKGGKTEKRTETLPNLNWTLTHQSLFTFNPALCALQLPQSHHELP